MSIYMSRYFYMISLLDVIAIHPSAYHWIRIFSAVLTMYFIPLVSFYDTDGLSRFAKTPQFSALALRMRCDGACRAVLKQSGLEAAALEQNVQCLI